MRSKLEQLLAELTSGDEMRAEAATVQFVSIGRPAFDALLTLTRHPEVDTRWWALRTLSEFTYPEISLILIQALEDAHPEILACAALGLSYHPDPQAIPKLLPLLSHQDHLLARLASNALIAIGSPAAQPLIELIESSETARQHARIEAVRALSEIQDPDSVETLFNIFQEGSSMMQHYAEEGLSRMGIGMVFFDPD